MLKAVSCERHEYLQKTPMISKRSGIQLDMRAKIIRGKRMLLKYEFHVSLITFTFHPERFLFILVLPSPMCDSLDQGIPTFLAPGTGFMEDHFSMDGEVSGEWLQDDSSALHLLCTLFLLLHQFYLRSPEVGDPLV